MILVAALSVVLFSAFTMKGSPGRKRTNDPVATRSAEMGSIDSGVSLHDVEAIAVPRSTVKITLLSFSLLNP